MRVYLHRCRRIATTASAELTNLNVVYGGVTTLIKLMTFVTRETIFTQNTEGTVALILAHLGFNMCHVLTGMFGINHAVVRLQTCALGLYFAV